MKDTDEMEMPCMCRCGEWFDLDEGNTSSKDNKTLICDTCYQEEESENERREQIEDLTSLIEDAVYTIKDCKKQLAELNAPYMKEINL